MIQNETIWIIGGTSGLGLAIVEKLAGNKNRLIVSARNTDVLQRMADDMPDITAAPCDITNPQSIQSAVRTIDAHFDSLDRLILCAGTCEYFDVENPDWGMMQRVMAVNYFGSIQVVEAALPLLRRSSSANRQLVAISSLAGTLPFPRAEAYGASKAAMSYFFRALRIDLAHENIAVTVVHPGFVETPLTANNDFPMPFIQTPNVAAEIIARKMEKKPALIQFPKRLAWPLWVMQGLPRCWYWLAVNKLSRRTSRD